jgi:glycosyltransferase involved in cell wall biosynthesis
MRPIIESSSPSKLNHLARESQEPKLTLMPTVSAIIPVWNRANLITSAIDSILAQQLPAGCSLQVIVVDDGSTDDLVGALRPYGTGVTTIRHDRNAGAAAARNTGIGAARGDYVAFLDSDDVWLPGKLAAQSDVMRKNSWSASCTAYYLSRPGRPEIVSPPYETGEIGLEDLVWGCFVSPGSTLMFERAVFDEIGAFDTGLQRLEDWDWLLRYARGRKLGFLAAPLARIEVSPGSDAARVHRILEYLWTKHQRDLSPRDRRHFAAALDLQRAAAHYYRGNMLPSVAALLKSFLRSPRGHTALSVVMHNWLARS